MDTLTESLKQLNINIQYTVTRPTINENKNYISRILKRLPCKYNKLLLAIGLSRNDVDIIRQGYSHPLYDCKIEKLYNLFNACSDRKRHLIHKYVKKIIRRSSKY